MFRTHHVPLRHTAVVVEVVVVGICSMVAGGVGVVDGGGRWAVHGTVCVALVVGGTSAGV